MITKTCSSDKIIGQVYRDFKPAHSGWIHDAIEWMGDAMEIIGVFTVLKETYEILPVIDYRAKLPCHADNILGFEYNGMRLQRSGGINNTKRCSCLDNLVCSVEESYIMNPNYIQTTFEEGCVTCYYEAIPVDCNGYPEVPDDAMFRQAVTWYIIRCMLMRGFKHQVITFPQADANWEKYYPRAQNRAKMPDIDGYEIFKKSHLGLVKSTNMTNEFFNTVVSGPSSVNSTATPGTLVQSFDPLGNNTNNT